MDAQATLPQDSARAPETVDAAFDALADPRRRAVLSVVTARDRPVDEADLAARVAAREADEPVSAVDDAERTRVRTSLHHVHLPKLADAGLVSRDPDDRTVSPTDRPVLDAPTLDAVLRSDAPKSAVAALASERRRVALTALRTVGRPLATTALAERVAAAEDGDAGEDDVLASLHHVHLPTLADAGLATYDPDARTAAYEGRPDVGAEWFVDPFRTDERRTLTGRERVVARGQALMADADEELFVLVSADGLLEPRCLDRLRDAAERGVDVFVGAESADARGRVRDRVPDARVWEPRSVGDAAERRLGRLVVADRRAVVLGRVGAARSDGRPAESAIAGEGADDVAVLVRDLLASRLDRGDADDAFAGIPL